LQKGFSLLQQTFQEWLQDRAPQLGAALAYHTVFSLAPLILVLRAIVGVIFRDYPAGTSDRVTQQMSYFLDPSAVQLVQNIAPKASQQGKNTIATIIGRRTRAFRRQRRVRSTARRLEYDLGRKGKARCGYLGISPKPLSLICDGCWICFLLLVSLTIEALLKGLVTTCNLFCPAELRLH
jgi:membrane protein